jgi:hypothetical protein
MAFIPRFTLTGAPPLVRNYAITASQEWDVYDLVGLGAAAALIELTAANTDVLGSALGGVGNTTTGQSDADELRPYLSPLTTGKHEPVAIFIETTVFETDDYNNTGAAAVGDVGENVDLEVVGGNWGINNGTSATASTPNFRIVDIERTRGTYLVRPNPIVVAGVFQWYDAAV